MSFFGKLAPSLIGCLALVCSVAANAAFPEKQITLVVPFTPGGANDAVARIVAQGLGKELQKNVVVDNRPGAGGMLGTGLVASAEPNGYTLLLISAAHAISGSIYAKMSYDPIKSFSPIAQLTSAPYILVVKQDSPVSSVSELISLAKSKPGSLNYASSGKGSAPQLSGAMFASMANLDMVHIAYKGGGPALMDLMRGDITMYFSSYSSATSLLKSNKIRALGVTSGVRSPSLPDTPTIAEAGLPGFELTGWYGIVAPANTPKAIVAQLNAALVKVLATPEVRAQLLTQGEKPTVSSAEDFSDFIKTEITKYANIARLAKIIPE